METSDSDSDDKGDVSDLSDEDNKDEEDDNSNDDPSTDEDVERVNVKGDEDENGSSESDHSSSSSDEYDCEEREQEEEEENEDSEPGICSRKSCDDIEEEDEKIKKEGTEFSYEKRETLLSKNMFHVQDKFHYNWIEETHKNNGEKPFILSHAEQNSRSYRINSELNKPNEIRTERKVPIKDVKGLNKISSSKDLKYFFKKPKKRESESSFHRIHNILIVGPPGVGKTCWLNSLSNINQYESLHEAKKFFMSGNNEMTEECSTFLILYKKVAINLTDTPGVGGHVKDKENIEMILQFARENPSTKTLLIFLQADEARITPALNYFVSHLLKPLLKINDYNVLWCFTFSKSCHFKSGNSVYVLNEVLRRHNLKIPLNNDVMYFFDNETYLYLVNFKQNKGRHLEVDKESAKISWSESKMQIERLFDYILN